MRLTLNIAFFSLLACLGGCISVPAEVVQLSAMTTTDLKALNDGYRALVRKHFAALRKNREQEFADAILAPYVEDAISQGRLLDVIQGKVVWDGEKEAFVAPTPARATSQKLDTLSTWNRQVAADIEGLRKDAFADLDTLEAQVLDQLDSAFGSVILANATIHAYLVSIEKIDKAQNRLLQDAGLGELPKKLNDALDKASSEAAKWTAKAAEADRRAMKLKNDIDNIKGK